MNSKIFLGLMILSLAAASSFGATIFLDTGERITGEIVQETGDFITFRSNNVDNQFNKKFIKRIFRDNAVINDNDSSNDREFCLKAGIDFPGQHTESDDTFSTTFDVASGISIAGEYTRYMSPTNIGVGYGTAYEIHRKLQDFSAQIGFLPVYAILKLRTTPNADNEFVYFMSQLGYNAFLGNDAYKVGGVLGGGLYYGVGFGVDLPLISYNLLYSSNSGTYTVNGFSTNIIYSKVSFIVGVKI